MNLITILAIKINPPPINKSQLPNAANVPPNTWEYTLELNNSASWIQAKASLNAVTPNAPSQPIYANIKLTKRIIIHITSGNVLTFFLFAALTSSPINGSIKAFSFVPWTLFILTKVKNISNA